MNSTDLHAHNRAVVSRYAGLFLDVDTVSEDTRPEPGAKRLDLLAILSKRPAGEGVPLRPSPALAEPLEVAS